ncbi:MAG: tetratricopeptide repeat protein [Acidobacteriota bacterium]|nr:tetratricopeptide repeat protein [Acidobacteriota bacterium]
MALALVSCNRDPNYLKKQYVERGNKFLASGKLNEASIYYRKAIGEDRKYGEAYYRLALLELKRNAPVAAVRPLRVAVELLKPGTPEANDATLKLAEIEVSAAAGVEDPEPLIKDVETFRDALLKHNPNSWEGHRLAADLALMEMRKQATQGHGPEAKKALEQAITEFRASIQANPNEYDTTLGLARVLAVDGEVPEAESMLKSLVEKDGSNLRGYLELYRLYGAQGKLPDAENILKKAIKSNPKDPSLRLELAHFYLVTNRRTELVALLNEMKGNLKDFPQAYVQSGDFFMRVGRFDDAIKEFDEGIAKDPKNKLTYLKHQVETYIHQNRVDLATAKNEQILKIDPKDPEARGLKATLRLDQGDYASATSELQSVVTARPDNYVAHFNLGRAYLGKGQMEQARQEFDKAVAIRPDYVVARLAQTQVALLRGDTDGALHDADELLRYVPNSPEGKVMKAVALQRMGKSDEARGILEPALEKNPKSSPLMMELGVLDLQEKKTKDAIAMFQRAYEASPTNVRALVGESRALLADGQMDKSVQLIADESKKNPDRADLEHELGNAQLSAGRFGDAINTYRDLLKKVKEPRQQAQLWIQIGTAYRYAGDLQQAISAFEKSRIPGLPDSAATIRDLGMFYEQVGKKDVARDYYKQAIKIDATDPLALNNLAFLLAENNGDLNEALSYAQRAKQKLPTYAEITDTLGWIYLKKNLTDSAIDSFKTIVVQQPNNPIYHYHYAMALNQKGDRENARKECQAALADKPDKAQEEQIRQLLSRLS